MFWNFNIFFLFNIFSIISFFLCLLFFSSKKKFFYSIYLGFLGIFFPLIYYIFCLKKTILLLIVIFLILFTGIIGWIISIKIDISRVPELITLMHSFIGLSAISIGYNNIFLYKLINSKIYLIEIFLSNFIGSFTFIGSIISYFKLINKDIFSIFFIGRKIFYLNIFLLFVNLFLFLSINNIKYLIFIYLLTFLFSNFLGLNILSSLDSSDIPIIISMLNAYSGLSSVISGFILNNNLLIIIGSLVSSSGFILSKKMCLSMNKSIFQIIFGKIFFKNLYYNTYIIKKKINKLSCIDVKEKIISFKNIIIVPGYGMALSQSQKLISCLMRKLLNKYSINIEFIIHPVAGRLPGHMNLLLAEANIQYKYIYSLDSIDDNFMKNKLVLAIGANDIINPEAISNKNCILYGMPVIKVWKSNFVIIFKRSMNLYNSGFSKVNNSIFYKKNVGVLFGDAKLNLQNLLDLI